MLRSAVSTSDPELVRLCRCKTWTLVESRLRSHPQEAEPSDFAKQGHGSTALSTAVRGGAPYTVVEALVKTNRSQLGVVHSYRGTILHEAIRHGVPLRIVRFLLDSLRGSEKSMYRVRVLEKADDMGRTVLHHAVLRALQNGDCSGTMWNLIKRLIMMRPSAVSATDRDGNTPLLLLLLHHNSSPRSISEAQMHRIVQLMVTTCPPAATIARKAPPLSYQESTRQTSWIQRSDSADDGEKPCVRGDGAPTPLTYALLYGRAEDTISLLLDVGDRTGPDQCLTLATGYHEVPLHLAVTLRSSVSLLKKLLDRCPASVHVRDKHKLTSLDWMWIRHVSDWCSDHALHPVPPSTRRYVASSNFAEWHKQATREEPNQFSLVLKETLWQRTRVLVQAAASSAWTEPVYKRGEPWNMVHATCHVRCPLYLVRLAVRKEGKHVVKVRDLRSGRLPIHYAAGRPPYKIAVPVGVLSYDSQRIEEESPVVDLLQIFPEGSRVADGNSQLPLHIAIDAGKRKASRNNYATVIDKLVKCYPDSLERRDGATKLYPFLQAACGQGASVNTIFCLILENPALAVPQ